MRKKKSTIAKNLSFFFSKGVSRKYEGTFPIIEKVGQVA
jgi:hypothetical protein